MAATPSKFWLVWRPDGYVPTKKHESEASAETESRRLAQVHPGKEFYVLEAIKMSTKPEPVETVRLTEDYPF